MVDAGDSADHAQAMYDESVTTVVLAAVVVAAIASIVLAVILARMLARPLAEVGGAARRIADGDYAARVPREGPEEIASLADSFNQMAASLERQEAMRRDFIANAAHELRTPLTNLQGYLEALRDGVITPDRATYDSLWDEAERLVRLSHSLDALAEGDAATITAAARRARPRGRRPRRRGARPADARPRRPDGRRRRPATACRRAPTPTTSPRSSATCCPTPRATRRPAAPSPSAPSAGRPTSWSRSPTPARASRPTTSTASSSASTASRSRATGRAAARASASPSSSSWSRPRAATVGAESRRRPDALLVQPSGLTAADRASARSMKSRRADLAVEGERPLELPLAGLTVAGGEVALGREQPGVGFVRTCTHPPELIGGPIEVASHRWRLPRGRTA